MKTTWTMRMLATGAATALVLALAPATAVAADYSALPTDELMAMRGTLQGATETEREQFRTEVQKRIQLMSPEELAEYGFGPRAGLGRGRATGQKGGPGAVAGSGDGTRPQPQDGTGFGPGDGTRPQPMDGTGFGAGGNGRSGGPAVGPQSMPKAPRGAVHGGRGGGPRR